MASHLRAKLKVLSITYRLPPDLQKSPCPTSLISLPWLFPCPLYNFLATYMISLLFYKFSIPTPTSNPSYLQFSLPVWSPESCMACPLPDFSSQMPTCQSSPPWLLYTNNTISPSLFYALLSFILHHTPTTIWHVIYACVHCQSVFSY